MQIAIWIASGLLALAMLGAGGMKLVMPRTKLMETHTWMKTWGDGGVKLLGLAELLGAVGLIVPKATGIAPILTPIAALCLVALMLGAVKVHRDLGQPVHAPAVLVLLGLFVALGHLGVV